MEFIDRIQTIDWLSTNHFPELSSEFKKGTNSLTEIKIPKKTTVLTAFTRSLFHLVENWDNSLIVFEDWSLYQEDEMQIVKNIRKALGETSNIIDKPGILFHDNEINDIIGICYNTQMFEWSIYLYSALPRIGIYFWEGHFLDIYSENNDLRNNIKKILETYSDEA